MLLTGITLLAGCDKFLEENPDNRVELNTPEKSAQLLTNAYTNAAYTFTEWMGDNVTYTTGTTKLLEHVQMYNWQDVTSVNQDTPPNFWTATYDAIAHSNEVLASISTMTGEEAKKNAVKGEAYLTRAYGHFMLVNIFAKQYDTQTASSDAGVPYVEEPETVFIKKYSRQTVEQVYNKIESDLLNGLKFVNGSYYANSGKYHFTLDAALAFASRFYLYKGDYNNCIKYSTQMLGSNPDVFLKDIRLLLKEKTNPDDFIRLYTSPTDQSNLLMIRNVTNFPVTVGYWPDSNLMSLIFQSNPWNASDIRYSNDIPLYVRGDNGLAVGKYQFLFERSSLTSNVGLYYTVNPVFRGEEVLLNRAESYAAQSKTALAYADLQYIVNKRYEGTRSMTRDVLRNYYGSTDDRNNLILFILEERRKEFISEGMRWFDIKRNRILVNHLQADGSSIRLTRDDLRKIIQIPQSAIDIGGLKPNSR